MNKIYIETYGCQMNVADSDIVSSILIESGYSITKDIDMTDCILINTCSIRDNAEQRIFKRLIELQSFRKKNTIFKIGVLGCMAERLKDRLLEDDCGVDFVVGPDAYRKLPEILTQTVTKGTKEVSVELSVRETYAEINPVRMNTNGVSAFISIMRGCENFCAFCVVPFTRGKERSRSFLTIINEAKSIYEQGYREVTLLGQNVNSYLWKDGEEEKNFAQLLAAVAEVNPLLRVRFATSHPKDISDELVETIAAYPNICKCIHLPFQSGSDRVLRLMRRKYTRAWYLERIATIKRLIPDCSLTTDIIAGFCTETEEDHQETLSLMKEVGYDIAFMFKYSERPNTIAAKKYPDDVSEEIKSRRLSEIITLQRGMSERSNESDIGKEFEVLVEGVSKRSDQQLYGRNTQNKVIVFDRGDSKIGDYVNVRVASATSATLLGRLVR